MMERVPPAHFSLYLHIIIKARLIVFTAINSHFHTPYLHGIHSSSTVSIFYHLWKSTRSTFPFLNVVFPWYSIQSVLGIEACIPAGFFFFFSKHSLCNFSTA